MYKIETAYHIIESSNNNEPELACVGHCKSVWWLEEFDNYNVLSTCPKCGGYLKKASNGEDFKVLEFIPSPNNGKKILSHRVKPEFIAMAKTKWA